MRPGVLVIRDEDRGSEMLFELRVADVPAWSTRTLTHSQWLLSQTWVRAKLALVDARTLAVDRPTRIGLLSALSNELSLPTLLIGTDETEAQAFRGVVAALPADATAKTIVVLVQRLLSDRDP